MDCSQGLTFYIYLPAGDYTEMTFAIEATDYSCCLKHFEDADNPITIVRNTYYPTTFSTANNGFVFIDPAKLVDGPTFNSALSNRTLTRCRHIVFEYKSLRPANSNILSTNDSPAPIYYTKDGNNMIVYTPAARIDANSNCSNMFYQQGGTTFAIYSIDFGSGFNTANVTNMNAMFKNSALGALDISFFNTENVTNMANMFEGCGSINNINLSNLNAESVTSMENMFKDCTYLVTLNLSGLTTSSALINTKNMFYNCRRLENSPLDLSGFDISSVTSANTLYMFLGTNDYGRSDNPLIILCNRATYDQLNSGNFLDRTYLAENEKVVLQVNNQ